MKFAKWGLACLVVIGLGHWSLSSRRTENAVHATAERTGRDHATAENPGLAASSPARAAAEEKERLARAHRWRMATSEDDRETAWKRMKATVMELSLESVRELLADPELLADVQGPEREDEFPNPTYPMREFLARMLWERYGELAPQEAIDLAFGTEARKDDPRCGYVLIGAAKADPELTLGFLADLPPGKDHHHALDHAAEQLMPLLAKHSPDKAFAVIEKLPELNWKEAYRGCLEALGPKTDWPKEVERLQQHPTGLWQIGFDSQSPAAALASEWVQSDPDAAFAWAASFPSEDRGGYYNMVYSWLQSDVSKAVPWLKEWQPEGVNRDRLYAKMLIDGGAGDMKVCDGLFELIEDPAVRNEAVAKAMKNCGNSIEPEILQHLMRSPLISEEARGVMRETLAKKEAGAED